MNGPIRAARVEEADILSDLARTSKAIWGYDADFMRACDVELIVTIEAIKRDVFALYEVGETIAGFYQLSIDDTAGEVESFFVAPSHIRQGVGAALWQHMTQCARQHGLHTLKIVSDPFAEPFYVAMGARRIGDTPSGSIPNRRLPLLEFQPFGP